MLTWSEAYPPPIYKSFRAENCCLVLFLQRETKPTFDVFIVQQFYLLTSWRISYTEIKWKEQHYHMAVYSVNLG